MTSGRPLSTSSELNNNESSGKSVCCVTSSLKLVMVGDSGVGKSCLVARLIDPSSSSPSFISTIGVEVRSHVVDNVKLQIWDTGGQQRYRAFLATCYRQVDVVLIVFDVTNTKSFLNVSQWMREINEAVANIKLNHRLNVLLVGNKCDCQTQSRVVSRERAEKFAKDHNMGYVETSARTGCNVRQAFLKAYSLLLQRQQQ